MGAQYWKSSKSIIPVVEEDGIVGLTFSPAGDNSLVRTYSNKAAPGAQHITHMNAFNEEIHEEHHGPSIDTKEGLYQLNNKGGNSLNGSSTASCSSASSQAGDTSSSCGSTAASSRVVSKRRSRTFTCAMPSPHRTAALIRKNFMQTFRNIG